MDKINSQIVFVSDTHIRHNDSSRHDLLIQVFESLDPEKVEAFILMGDIFDFFFAASRYFDKKFKNFFDALDRVAQSGIRVIFVQGNHEFSLDELKWKNIQVISSRTHQYVGSDGAKFLLTHGDKIFHDPYYELFSRITRSWIFKVCALAVPQKFLDRFILSWAKKSRSKDEYRTLNHQKLLGLANQLIADTDNQHLVFGHFHHPYLEDRADKKGKIVSFNAWDKPNVLLFDEGRFEHLYL